MKQKLESYGLLVNLLTDSASITEDATGKALILVSSSVSSVNMGNKFRNVPVPMINNEWALQDNFS